MSKATTNYKEIFDLSHLGYFIINKNYDILYKNNSGTDILNVSKAENFSNLLDDSNFILFKNNLELSKKNKSNSIFILYNIFMNYKYIEFTISSTISNGSKLFLVTLKDITKEHKDSLIQSCCYDISEAIYDSDDLDTLYHQIHIAVSKITNTNNFYISLVDWSCNKIDFPYYIDSKDKKPNSRYFKNCLTEFVITNGKAVLINKDNNYDNFIKKNNINVVGEKCKNWLGIPLKLTNGKTIGMIGIQSYSSSNIFTQEDLKLLLLVSNQIATAIKRKKDDIFIHQQANYDHLTGLTNKALFYDRLEHAILQAQRHDEVIAVLFLDIDDFKIINDTMGHPIGDELLKIIGNIIKTSVRKSDTVSRWGGDEFCILLPNIKNEEGIFKLCDRILNNKFSNIKLNKKNIKIMASIGISLYPNDGIKPEKLIENADAAMYHSKKNGKNQYKLFSSM